MKRKLLLALIALTCALCLVFSLAGCNPAENQSGTQQETPGGQSSGGSGSEDFGGQGSGGSGGSGSEDFGGQGSGGSGNEDNPSGQGGGQQGGNSDDDKPDTHNYIFKCSQTEHWQVCTDCGEETAHTPHSVSDGVCPACGYVEKCTEGLKFTEIEENGEIIGYGVKDTAWIDDSHVFIPSYYNNLPVTFIGDYAFSYCVNLKEITIGNNITSIGSEAFSYCVNLTEITIPDSVNFIDSKFSYCKSLKGIYINDISAWYKIDFGDISTNPLYYAHNLYLKVQLVTNLEIPNGVTAIKNYVFSGCTSLESITIPASVTSIGDGAFAGCTSLESITIPASVTSIGDGAFEDCTSLTEITIPDSITSIGYDAFAECTSLERVNINDLAAWCNIDFSDVDANPLVYAGNLYLKGQLVTNLEIPNGVTIIINCVFRGCTSLESITIPANVISIDEHAFHGCTSLESITVDKDNKVYRSEGNCLIEIDTKTVILGCKTSEIPDSVTYIGWNAFAGCTSLTEITIPDSVTSIGDGAFSGCAKA